MIFGAITRNGLFGITVNIISVQIRFFSSTNRKGKRDASIALVNRQIFQSTCYKQSPTSVTIDLITFSSFDIKGGMLPANDSCNLPCACLNERLSYMSCSFAAL